MINVSKVIPGRNFLISHLFREAMICEFLAAALLGILFCGSGEAYAKWSYESFVDEMTGKSGQSIETSSINSVSFGFPYSGPQHGELALHRHPRYGTNVSLSIARGQFICGISHCDVLVRFDDGEPVEYTAGKPADHSSNVLFLYDYEAFLSNLLKSKVVRIEVQFYQEGAKVFTFSAVNIPEPFLNSIKKDQRDAENARLDAKKRQEQQAAIEQATAMADVERQTQEVDRKQREAVEAKRRAEAAARAAQQKAIDDWRARIQSAVKNRVVLPPNIEGNPEARFEVVLLPGGEVLSATLKKSSGNPAYDAAVERAINRTSPLPVPSDTDMFQENFRELTLVLRPRDIEVDAPSSSGNQESRLLDQYRQMISARVIQYEEYPPIAKRRHWEGTTVVQLTMTPDGKVARVSVLEKSGHDILDEAAIRMIQKAGPLPLPPEGLRSRDQVIAFPVRWKLEQ